MYFESKINNIYVCIYQLFQCVQYLKYISILQHKKGCDKF